MRNLQYQLSNGSWVNCDERTAEFIEKCQDTTGKTNDEIIAELETGKKIRNDKSDWYSNCRFQPAQTPKTAKLVCNDQRGSIGYGDSDEEW